MNIINKKIPHPAGSDAARWGSCMGAAQGGKARRVMSTVRLPGASAPSPQPQSWW